MDPQLSKKRELLGLLPSDLLLSGDFALSLVDGRIWIVLSSRLIKKGPTIQAKTLVPRY